MAQSRTLVKNFVEVMHLPAKTQVIKELISKWGGSVETSTKPELEPQQSSWITTVVMFFDRRKSTSFSKAVTQQEGIGSVRRSSQDVTYAYLPVQRVSVGRSGMMSVLPQNKKRPVSFRIEHTKATQQYGLVGRTNPRTFWYDEAEIGTEEDTTLDEVDMG